MKDGISLFFIENRNYNYDSLLIIEASSTEVRKIL